MAARGTNTEAPEVVLYGPAGVVSDTRGALVSAPDEGISRLISVAVFAPWPDALSYRTPFAVAAIGDGSQAQPERWFTPRTVDLFRLQGGLDETYVATVRLHGSAVDEAPETSYSRGELLDRLTATRSIAQTLGNLPSFRTLSAPARTSLPGLPANAPETALPTSFLAEAVDGSMAWYGLCRIFHWD